MISESEYHFEVEQGSATSGFGSGLSGSTGTGLHFKCKFLTICACFKNRQRRDRSLCLFPEYVAVISGKLYFFTPDISR